MCPARPRLQYLEETGHTLSLEVFSPSLENCCPRTTSSFWLMPLSHLHESEPLHSISGNVEAESCVSQLLLTVESTGLGSAAVVVDSAGQMFFILLLLCSWLESCFLLLPAGAAMYRPLFVLFCSLWNSSSPSRQTHILIGRGEISRECKQVDGKAFSSNAIAQLL